MSPRRKTPGLSDLWIPSELQRFLVTKAGVKQTFRVMEFLALWGMVADELGREPTRSEFCEHWEESEANYYRRLSAWRAVWPDDANPQRVWEWNRAQQIAHGVEGVRFA